jgi:hypothetical protein
MGKEGASRGQPAAAAGCLGHLGKAFAFGVGWRDGTDN